MATAPEHARSKRSGPKRDGPQPVTVVMATRNGAAHLSEQLQSLAAQTHSNWSLFVSDDGSTDSTRQILAEFARAHPVALVEGPQQGAAANFLSALCHPDLPQGTIALADQDDIWLPGKLARGLRRMQATPGDGPLLYAAESALADSTGKPFAISHAGSARPGFAASLAQNLFGGHTTMLNAEALALIRKAGPQPGIVFHDWWIYQLIAGAGGRLVLDPAPMALYRQHGANVLGSGGALSRLRRILSLRWKAEMQTSAAALARVDHLLTAQSRQTLQEFLSSPGFGPTRVARLHKLGIRRSSAVGTAMMMGAAFVGLL